MNKFFQDCETIIKVLEAQNKHLKNRIQSLEAAQPKWISVKKRLPKKPGKYIAYSNTGRIYTAWYDPEIYQHWPHFAKNVVTHWMARPKPPREDE